MYRKNTASQFICVQLLLTATGAVATGLSPAARRCIDGTFAGGGGTFTEDGTTGSYKYALAQADTNDGNGGYSCLCQLRHNRSRSDRRSSLRPDLSAKYCRHDQRQPDYQWHRHGADE